MKKLKLKIAMAAVVADVAGYVTYQNQAKEVMSELVLANVEALANMEYGDGFASVVVTELPPSGRCKGGVWYECENYSSVCLGSGSLNCVQGTIRNCTPTSSRCA